MKKIIFIVAGIIFVAVLGRGIWAWQQMKADEERMSDAPSFVTTTAATSTTPVVTTPVVATTPKPCSLPKKTNEILVSGRVVFPSGVKISDGYTIISILKPYPISIDGTFCAIGIAGRPFIITAVPNVENGFVLAGMINSNIDSQNLVIDVKSTAVSLVYMSPLVGPGNPNPKILDIIASNVDVLKFGDSINAISNLTINDLDTGGRLFNDYTNAVTSVIKSLVTTTTTPSTIEFTAVFSLGFYSTNAVQGTMTSVTPTFVGVIDVKKILQRVFIVDDSTKFVNTAKPVGTQIIEFKSANITGYYDVRKQKVFVESISNVQL